MSESGFNEELFGRAYPPGIEKHFWTMARNKIVFDSLKRSGSGGGVVLDIGCGRGITVKYLRTYGVNCYGSEIATNLDAKEEFIFFESDALALPIAFRESVTCILLLDVLEHFPDPAEFLKACRKAFPSLQRLIVTLPARQELWSNYDEYYGHHRRYSIQTARQLMRESGFESSKGQYFFHSLYLLGRWQKIFFGKREVVIKAPQWLFLHRLAGKFFWYEYSFLPSRIFGSSILIEGELLGGF